jgi:molybdopterin-guanine dinucleotide biosynthesis protein
MEVISLPNILLIAGTGRNSGKTTFACEIIKKFSPLYPIVAVKVSSHFHRNAESGIVIQNQENLHIAEETNASTSKDSSLMLAAGAKKTYFIMASDNMLGEALHTILSLVEKTDFIVCESGGLRNWVVPGLFFMMHGANNKNPKPGSEAFKEFCDRWVTLDSNGLDFNINSIHISDNRWILKEEA